MQGWLWERAEHPGDFWTLDLVEAYLSKVPDDGMIVLDLNSYSNPVWKRVKSYFGKKFIWCAIVIFGGRRDIYGDMGRMASGPAAALADPTSTMDGIGFTPEAIHSNPVVFDLLLENAWRAEPVTTISARSLNPYAVNSTHRQIPFHISMRFPLDPCEIPRSLARVR